MEPEDKPIKKKKKKEKVLTKWEQKELKKKELKQIAIENALGLISEGLPMINAARVTGVTVKDIKAYGSDNETR